YCLHRYARLLDGCGNAQRIVCPYHAWTYDASGALIGITDPDGFVDVDKADLSLEKLACEVWLGFVFVSVNHELAPVEQRLKPLADHLSRYGLSEFEDRYSFNEEIWDGNWKLVFENFVECYHVTYAHKQSIGPTNPTHLAELGPRGEPHFSIHHNPYRVEDYPEIHNETLDEDERRRLHVIGIYPNLLVAIDPNFVWWMMLEPLAVDRTNARWGLSFSPQAMQKMTDPDAYAEAIRNVIRIATDEDKEIVARVQDGAGFGTEQSGYLHSSLEIYVDEFRRYVERMMAV
ncbi:MAG: Rieske 2Fe-2S domain-containing protein, partial [Hyphomicrobiales bacterium]|nr:Rieske 2Fe-2S domain-containing protein [Hyphomicrobiales bacterium]